MRLLFQKCANKIISTKRIICGDYFIKIQIQKNPTLNNSLWKKVLNSWWQIKQKQIPECINELIEINIWRNNKITVDHKSIFYEHYIKMVLFFYTGSNR